MKSTTKNTVYNVSLASFDGTSIHCRTVRYFHFIIDRFVIASLACVISVAIITVTALNEVFIYCG